MTTTTRRRRAPSTRYLNMACSTSTLGAAGGQRQTFDGFADMVTAAETVAAGREAVVWVHDTPAMGFPERLPADHAELVSAMLGRPVRPIGSNGWLVVDGDKPLHLAFPAYSGDFAGLATAGELLDAVEAFRDAVGFAYVISSAKTIHTLIANSAGNLPESHVEPELDGWAATAWATPSNWWGLDAGGLGLLAAGGARAVRAFDRVGSYLSAWQGITLPTGVWRRLGAGMLAPGPESGRPCGYWLLADDALPSTSGLFDPWARHGVTAGAGRWVTTPLAQLAVDIAGEAVPVLDAWVTDGRSRALDNAGVRLRDARIKLRAPGPPERAAARDAAYQVLKGAYAGATAWFEYGPRPPDPLARPAWRRTIIDRYAANTWRNLDRTTPGPFAVGEIDTALYALPDYDTPPDGLRLGDGLGQWKPKGRPLPIADACTLLAHGGHRALLRALEPA